MDHILLPTIFDADPHPRDATKRQTHWFRTFRAYTNSIKPEGPNELETMVCHSDHTVCDCIAEFTGNDSAIKLLEKLYIRPKDIVCARHLLATYKQEPCQDFDQFVQKQKSLAKDCESNAVSAVEHTKRSNLRCLDNRTTVEYHSEEALIWHKLDLDKALSTVPPHGRFTPFTRRSGSGISLPTWLTVPGPILLKRNDQEFKYDPPVEKVELVFCDSQFIQMANTKPYPYAAWVPTGNSMTSDPPDAEKEPTHAVEQEEPHSTPPVYRDYSEIEILTSNEALSTHYNADPGNHLDIFIRQQCTHTYSLHNREA
ncbi:hypothetical protein CLF_112441 [Clonorchis sinensis]|uniref:Uncharacterized protein n=1 Tax=Clonorchis sinensis TaxID=79923 RepID=G7YMI3_CLOSI|nr:hypothetical protein CLF_112441 [Clonorchis sinensis]